MGNTCRCDDQTSKKNILIIFSHPDIEGKSFNHCMLNAVKEYLEKNKFNVRVEDLVKAKFNVIGGYADFKEPKNPTKLDYIDEQKSALQNDNWSEEIKPYIDNLKWCDYIIHIFPLYRFSVPAIHKGWCDRVMAYNNLQGKKWLTITTAGQPKEQFRKEGLWGMSVEELLMHFNVNCPKFLSMESLPMYAVYRANELSAQERDQAIKDLIEHIKKVIV